MELLAALPQLADLIQKAGVIGVLLIACAALVYEVRRGRAKLHEAAGLLQKTFAERDSARLIAVRLHTLCEAHKISVDLAGLKEILQSAPATTDLLTP